MDGAGVRDLCLRRDDGSVFFTYYFSFLINLGSVFSFYINDKMDLILRPYFDYKYLTHKVRQKYSYHLITFTQVNPDRILYNNIYSFNIYFGLRVNLFKVERYPLKTPRYLLPATFYSRINLRPYRSLLTMSNLTKTIRINVLIGFLVFI